MASQTEIDSLIQEFIDISKSIPTAALAGAIAAATAVVTAAPVAALPYVVALAFLPTFRSEYKGRTETSRTEEEFKELRKALNNLHREVVSRGADEQEQYSVLLILREILVRLFESKKSLESATRSVDSMQEICSDIYFQIAQLHQRVNRSLKDIQSILESQLSEQFAKAIDEKRIMRETREATEFEWEYLRAFQRRFGEIQLVGLARRQKYYSLDLGFVPLTLAGSGEYSAAHILEQHEQLFLEASLGMGKSTLLQ